MLGVMGEGGLWLVLLDRHHPMFLPLLACSDTCSGRDGSFTGVGFQVYLGTPESVWRGRGDKEPIPSATVTELWESGLLWLLLTKEPWFGAILCLSFPLFKTEMTIAS